MLNLRIVLNRMFWKLSNVFESWFERGVGNTKQSSYNMACALNSRSARKRCQRQWGNTRWYLISVPGHKDLRMQENAWNAVSNSLDFVDSPTKAKAYFENSKKRCTKKCLVKSGRMQNLRLFLSKILRIRLGYPPQQRQVIQFTF